MAYAGSLSLLCSFVCFTSHTRTKKKEKKKKKMMMMMMIIIIIIIIIINRNFKICLN